MSRSEVSAIERVSQTLSLNLAVSGIASPSVLVGVMVVLYGSNSLASLVIVLLMYSLLAPIIALGIGAAIAAVMLALACFYFERKQL